MRKLCGTILAAVAIAAKVAVADIVQGDAAKMGAEMMNPGNGLGCLEREGSGEFKVLIYGNSIALYGPKADIGWTNCWGMAASAAEKDFAHLVVAGPLGSVAENKALGLFAHDGVANHPGDLGMRRLADLILDGFRSAK